MPYRWRSAYRNTYVLEYNLDKMKSLIIAFIILYSYGTACFGQDTNNVLTNTQTESGYAEHNWFKREKCVASHAQPTWLRIIKFPIFLLVGFILYRKKGWRAVLFMVLFLLVFGIVFHFFLRYMTDGWTKEWWFVKKISTPYD